jgi:hypothetical protein
VLLIALIFFLLFLIAFRYVPFLQLKKESPWLMPLAFTIKVAVGIVFLSIYLKPDPANPVPTDAMRYLSESRQLADVFHESPSDFFSLMSGIGETPEMALNHFSDPFLWGSRLQPVINDSKNTVRLHALIQQISFGSPWVHMVFFSFLGLIGLRQLFIAIKTFSNIKPTLIFLTLLILPSFLFWTSGILKEPLMLLGLGFALRAFLGEDSRLKRLLFGFFGILFILFFKTYILPSLLLAFMFYLIYKYLTKYKTLLSLGIFSAIILFGILFIPKGKSKLLHTLSRKQYDFIQISRGGLHANMDTCFYYFSPSQYDVLGMDKNDSMVILKKSTQAILIPKDYRLPPRKINLEPTGEKWPIYFKGRAAQSFIPTTYINNSWSQLIKNTPEALINSSLRPFPNDPGSWMKYLAIVEGWVVFCLLIFAIIKRKTLDFKTRGVIISLMIFAISLFLLIGWTIPVIGAIVRYRFPAQLALVIMALILLKKPQKFSHE